MIFPKRYRLRHLFMIVAGFVCYAWVSQVYMHVTICENNVILQSQLERSFRESRETDPERQALHHACAEEHAANVEQYRRAMWRFWEPVGPVGPVGPPARR